ncbi:hypothetical protein HPB48_021150 [Haemaphysalis longicornis]|uniref:Uncharacterized protein n=1 Tax=Haemaphysalis longicornis TaxID=44386 RepID=A0A9J6FMS6_HAELO|nr:hypothetical protein HPB48_021150 [Haemaphysalis longicornis]
MSHILRAFYYRNVLDIDLYSGGLSEKAINGSQMGETFACIVRDAFKRLKFGDRFYYEHENQSGSFTQGAFNGNTAPVVIMCLKSVCSGTQETPDLSVDTR